MKNKNKKQTESVFMQMHNGTRMCEGSFNVALKELFYLAGQRNRRTLVSAFPEFFGDEVPEFAVKSRNFTYKGWLCKWSEELRGWILYTDGKVSKPSAEITLIVCRSDDECKNYIDAYIIDNQIEEVKS